MSRSNKHPRYTYIKGGYYYFTRIVPGDIREHFNRSRIVVALRTKSLNTAKKLSFKLNVELESHFDCLRINNNSKLKTFTNSNKTSHNTIVLSKALESYLRVRGADKSEKFHKVTKRQVSRFITYFGNRAISEYRRDEINKFRDILLDNDLSSSTVRRILATISAVVSFAVKENNYTFDNNFKEIVIPKNVKVTRRLPIRIETLRLLQSMAIEKPTNFTTLFLLLSDSGMRLSEGLGLLLDDIKLDEEIPHVIIKNHSHRRLKTEASERIIPLVGFSLYAANYLLKNRCESPFCFPKYNSNGQCSPYVASQRLNLWIKEKSGKAEYVIHSLRHSFRDRLRNSECPSEVIDQLGGWSNKTVGQAYGLGYKLDMLYKYMLKIEV